VEKHPVEPGEVAQDMHPPPSVGVSFKMMVNSIKSLQEWYRQTAADAHTPKEKNKHTKIASRYLQMLGLSPQYVSGLIEDIAEGGDACHSASYPGIFRNSEALDVEIRTFGTMPMHMCALGIEKSLISKTSMLANRVFKNENAMWKNLTTSMSKSQRSISKLSVEWCLAMTYSGKEDHTLGTANWQSDHFLGFTRLSLYHFSSLGGGNSPPEGKEKILSSFRRVRVLWFCLISNMLAEEKVTGCKIDNLVKLFLSSCSALHLLTDRVVQGSKSSGNMPEECIGRKRAKKKKPKEKKKKNKIERAKKNTTSERRSTRTNECNEEKRKDCDLPRQEREQRTKKRQKTEVPKDSNMPASKKHPKKEAVKKPKIPFFSLGSELP